MELEWASCSDVQNWLWLKWITQEKEAATAAAAAAEEETKDKNNLQI